MSKALLRDDAAVDYRSLQSRLLSMRALGKRPPVVETHATPASGAMYQRRLRAAQARITLRGVRVRATDGTVKFHDAVVFVTAVGLLMLSPIIRGGNRQVVLMVLLFISLILFASLVAHWVARSVSDYTAVPEELRATPGYLKVLWFLLACSPMWIGGLQLSGFGAVESDLTAIEQLVASPIRSVVANPQATWASIWAGLPLVAAGVVGLVLRRRDLEIVVRLILVGVFAQALIALLQAAQGPDSRFYFNTLFNSSLIGTFNNRNHLANYFALTIPLWFYVLSVTQLGDNYSGDSKSSRKWLLPGLVIWALAVILVLLGGQSRAGLVACTIAALLSLPVFSRNINNDTGARWRLVLATACAIGCIALVASQALGFDHVVERFLSDRVAADASIRSAYTQATLEAARHFWPLGSGLGTFESVFPRFQKVESIGYVSYAHNDYAQLVMETGVLGLVMCALAAIVAGRQALDIFIGMRSGRVPWKPNSLQLFAAISLLAFMLHSRVEFNMHIPALAITAAFLFGVFLRPISQDPFRRSMARKARRR